MPPKPLHPVFTFTTWVAWVLVFVAMLSLDYKNHAFVDIFVGMWVITIYVFDLISYNFLNIIIALAFLALSVALEVLWFLVYPPVSSPELVDQRLHRRRLAARRPPPHLLHHDPQLRRQGRLRAHPPRLALPRRKNQNLPNPEQHRHALIISARN